MVFVHITTNPHLPFNWDELYQEIAPFDNFAASILDMNEGDVLIYRHFPHAVDEKNIYALEFAKKHTNTEQFMGLSAEAVWIFGLDLDGRPHEPS